MVVNRALSYRSWMMLVSQRPSGDQPVRATPASRLKERRRSPPSGWISATPPSTIFVLPNWLTAKPIHSPVGDQARELPLTETRSPLRSNGAYSMELSSTVLVSPVVASYTFRADSALKKAIRVPSGDHEIEYPSPTGRGLAPSPSASQTYDASPR